MDNFRKKFIEEATEHIQDLEQALLELEHTPTNKPLIERVFRAMHSLKGSGAMFGFEKISEFTHHLETIYDLVRNDELSINSELLNLTLKSVDHLSLLLNEENESPETLLEKHNSLIKQIEEFISANKESSIDPFASKEVKKTEKLLQTFFITFQPNEDIMKNGTNPLFLIDELYSIGPCISYPIHYKIPFPEDFDPDKCYTSWQIYLASDMDINSITDVFIFVEDECVLEVNQIHDTNLLENTEFIKKIEDFYKSQKELTVTEVNDIVSGISQPEIKQPLKSNGEERVPLVTKEQTISSIRVSSDKLDQLMNLVSEMVTTQARLSLYAEQDGRSELLNIAENVQKLSRQLRDNAFSIVLIPIENMLTRFQRLVRDLSKELKKDVTFEAEGTDTELDKTIIENLTDPLMHIMRNSLDHGIELPDVRVKMGKPAQGKILLKAFYSGANVIIQVFDDGAGIDPNFIRTKAIAKGLISPEAQLSKREILDLVFIPGFSTASKVTDVSGRGVGMDVVKRKIADIRGEVELESEIGVGTTLTIKLPLTLSIIDGLLVKVDEIFYVIPLSVIDKIYAIEHRKLMKSFNNMVVLDGEQIPYFYLRNEFFLPESTIEYEEIIVVRYEDKRVGITVDTVIGEYQAVLKPLGKHYKKQEIISGATILGDGTIALVLDTNKAIKQFANQTLIKEEVQ
jgi:two-component system, chemotaxis family, sensor kinase CheA